MFFHDRILKQFLKELPKTGGEIRLISLQGKIVSRGRWARGLEDFKLSFAHLPKGIFMIEIWPKEQDRYIQKISIF